MTLDDFKLIIGEQTMQIRQLQSDKVSLQQAYIALKEENEKLKKGKATSSTTHNKPKK